MEGWKPGKALGQLELLCHAIQQLAAAPAGASALLQLLLLLMMMQMFELALPEPLSVSAAVTVGCCHHSGVQAGSEVLFAWCCSQVPAATDKPLVFTKFVKVLYF
jgi:hypothetical protein